MSFLGVLIVALAICLGAAVGSSLRKRFYPQSPTPKEELKMFAEGVKLNVNIGSAQYADSTLLDVVHPCDLHKIEQALRRYQPSCPFIDSISHHTVVKAGKSMDAVTVKLSAKSQQNVFRNMYSIQIIDDAIYLCSNGNSSSTVFEGVLEVTYENDSSVSYKELVKRAREVCRARVLNEPCKVPFHPGTPDLAALIEKEVACYRDILNIILATKNQ